MGTKFPSVPGSGSSFSLRQTDFWNDSQLSPSLFRMVSAEFMIISTIKHNSHNEDMGKHSLDFTAFKYPSGTQLWRKPSPKTPGEGNGCVLSIRWVTQPAWVKNPYNQLCPKSQTAATKAGGGEVSYFCPGTQKSMAPAHPRLWGSPAASAQRSALFLN